MKKFLKFVGGMIVALLVVGFLVGRDDRGGPSSPSITAATATPPAPEPPSARERMASLMPTGQAAVVAAVEAARRRFDSAPNDMAKGAARPARARAICAALRSPLVAGWAGIVSKLDTNGEGKGVLEVEIGPDAYVKTWNNSLSDIGDNTLIEPSSTLFTAASQLREGQLVRFDGTFFRDSTDCVRESSMSLSGSIREPEFIFRFLSISRIE